MFAHHSRNVRIRIPIKVLFGFILKLKAKSQILVPFNNIKIVATLESTPYPGLFETMVVGDWHSS